MTTSLAELGQAASNPQQLARRAARNPGLRANLLAGLSAKAARIKFGCAKALRLLSEERPDLLYPQFDFFVGLLDAKNKVLQWDGAFVLSQLARVDAEDKLGAIWGKYFSPISGPVMITAAQAIQGGARIARAKPHLAGRIATEVLKVGRARYQTLECRNVAIGHAILALGSFFDLIQNPAPVIRFVSRQTRNSRAATREKARQFLKQARATAAKSTPTKGTT